MFSLSGRATVKTVLGHALWPAAKRYVTSRTSDRSTGLIYTFHYIGSPVVPGLGEDLFLTRDAFCSALDFIARELTPLDPLEFLDGLEAGTLPPRAVMLTFDDGTRDGYTIALPELKQRNLTACFFVCPGLIQTGRTVPCLELMDLAARCKPGHYSLRFSAGPEAQATAIAVEITADPETRRALYRRLFAPLYRTPSHRHAAIMADLTAQLGVDPARPASFPLATWAELDQMYAQGMWIANHTMLHSTCYADPVPQFARDMEDAYAVLEQRYPAPRRIFCYPYGSPNDVTESAAAAVGRSGAMAAFTNHGGIARKLATPIDPSGMLLLPREDASYSAGGAKLAPLLALLR